MNDMKNLAEIRRAVVFKEEVCSSWSISIGSISIGSVSIGSVSIGSVFVWSVPVGLPLLVSHSCSVPLGLFEGESGFVSFPNTGFDIHRL